MILPLSDRQTYVQTLFERLIAAAPTETGNPGTPVNLDTLACDANSAGYLQALLDMLALLGVVTCERAAPVLHIPSVSAGFCLRMLQALLASDAPLVADWNCVGVTAAPSHPFATGVDLLAALERRRRDLMPDAPPLREIHAAIGVIERCEPSGERAYLLHWDAAARQWQLVGGRFESGDVTLRATMLRELSEELACSPLIEGVHFLLEERGPRFAEERLSPTYGLYTRTIFQAYLVTFLTKTPPLYADLRWVTETEVLAGMTTDKQSISAEPFLRIRAHLDPGM